MELIGVALITIGLVFRIISVIGVIRFPDAFTRLHATGKAATVGLFGLLAGASFIMPALIWKALALGLFMLAAAPVVSHAIASAERSPHSVRE
ncbi:MAG: Na+/H+ antiporter subunit G [Phototrophicales bacterium]|nr:MAG: Na+/H+ antiporter subunit G [Phototrophicales bacterium]